jgi:hypothetical protein
MISFSVQRNCFIGYRLIFIFVGGVIVLWCKYIEKAGQRAFIALSSAYGDGVYPFHLC